MDTLPADVLMLINKFVWGSPTAKLIKQAPKWKLDLRIISEDGEHYSDYETEEDYWSDFTLDNEMHLLNMLHFQNEFETDEFLAWQDRYLNTYF